jgi:hypothetical protein
VAEVEFLDIAVDLAPVASQVRAGLPGKPGWEQAVIQDKVDIPE